MSKYIYLIFTIYFVLKLYVQQHGLNLMYAKELKSSLNDDSKPQSLHHEGTDSSDNHSTTGSHHQSNSKSNSAKFEHFKTK